MVKRFAAYQTIGGLFQEAADGVIQRTVPERVWGILQELVRIIAETFETDDECVLDALINRSETFKHYINFERLEMAKTVWILLSKLEYNDYTPIIWDLL